MVKGGFTIVSLSTVLCAGFLLVSSAGGFSLKSHLTDTSQNVIFTSDPVVQAAVPSASPPASRVTRAGATLPPSVSEVLKSGTLIVISKGAQKMYVFKDGALWESSPVSTGKPGKDTPSGVFPVLQKRVFHRSNLYSNAPMPHMQRLTWGGIAIHAGHLPGYPASHGCIRVPKSFARALFQHTDPEHTTVVVVNQRLQVAEEARQLALAMPGPLPGARGHLLQKPEPLLADLDLLPKDTPALAESQPRLPYANPAFEEQNRPVIVAASHSPAAPINLLEQTRKPVHEQTIQLAAKGSPGEAEAYWARISTRFPELGRYRKMIIPAVVHSRQYYRLRVTGPDAKAMCSSMKQSGADCFPVS